METATRYYGKHRGVVVNNVDPMQKGRIQAMVPDVYGDTPSTWALPCVPITGMQSGLFTVPPMNAGVWIEFEQGDPDYPIWVGGFWGAASETPSTAKTVPPGIWGMTIQSMLGTSVLISDVPGPTGGIMLKHLAGAMISINETGITISNGQGASIMLTGPTVNVNAGALTVT